MLTIGVDAHKRVHAAVAVDGLGRRVDQWRGPNTPAGWEALTQWARALEAVEVVGVAGRVDAATPARRWGIEGAWGYGRGLAQALVHHGEPVVDVNPRLSAGMRRRSRGQGKNDRLDAQAVARVVCQDETALPEVVAEDGTTVLGVWSRERRALVAEATRLRNRAHRLLADLDPAYGATIPDLTTHRGVAALAAYAPADPDDVLAAARAGALRRLGAQLQLVTEQLIEVTRLLDRAGAALCAPLLDLYGVGGLTASELAAALGPGKRFPTDAMFAANAGVAPVEASSGEVVRHRLTRSGNRGLNAILERIVLTQGRGYPAAQAYLARKRAEGKSDREARRALKRFIARAVWRTWRGCTPPSLDDIRPFVIPPAPSD